MCSRCSRARPPVKQYDTITEPSDKCAQCHKTKALNKDIEECRYHAGRAQEVHMGAPSIYSCCGLDTHEAWERDPALGVPCATGTHLYTKQKSQDTTA